MAVFKTISPVDDSVYCETPYAEASKIESALSRAEKAFIGWKNTTLEERKAICQKVISYFEENVKEISEEITWQMGRPIQYAPFEIKGFKERAQFMIDAAETALEDEHTIHEPGFEKFIRKEPLGTLLVLCPWNYPYLTAVNSIIPAIVSGNCVILKHAEQTPLCAERFTKAFLAAGCPPGVFQHLHLAHEQIPAIINDSRISSVFFTGSVSGGRAIQNATSQRFIATGLELGGKDPAYVAEDAAIDQTVENLVDGAFFNSGQSCCGIERIYVHQNKMEEFLHLFQKLTSQYVVGNPTKTDTTLGPLVRTSAAVKAQEQIIEAIKSGGQPLITENTFSNKNPPFLNPQAIYNATHEMSLMTEESFAPIVGVMEVKSDEEAVVKMNDSRYGLTASIWTNDRERALKIGARVESGTWYMNRCDYLDPSLAWTGVKDSGKGVTLSSLGYHSMTRPKSFHLKLEL